MLEIDKLLMIKDAKMKNAFIFLSIILMFCISKADDCSSVLDNWGQYRTECMNTYVYTKVANRNNFIFYLNNTNSYIAKVSDVYKRNSECTKNASTTDSKLASCIDQLISVKAMFMSLNEGLNFYSTQVYNLDIQLREKRAYRIQIRDMKVKIEKIINDLNALIQNANQVLNQVLYNAMSNKLDQAHRSGEDFATCKTLESKLNLKLSQKDVFEQAFDVGDLYLEQETLKAITKMKIESEVGFKNCSIHNLELQNTIKKMFDTVKKTYSEQKFEKQFKKMCGRLNLSDVPELSRACSQTQSNDQILFALHRLYLEQKGGI